MLRKRSYYLSEDVKNIKEKWGRKGVTVFAYEIGDKTIILSSVKVPESEREKGVGTKFMKDLISYTDKTGQKIALTPSKDFGASSVSRLKKFYKRFGFVENKGKNKDYSISETMYRESK